MKKETVDFLFLRFLNFRVVTSSDAKNLFQKICKTVKKNGYIICFGHTPVLLNKEYFEKSGFNVIKSHEYDKTRNAIFQYFLLKRK